MKLKVHLLIIFSHFFLISAGQMLPLKELVILYNSEVDDLGSNLLSKGWVYVGNENGKYVWSFNKINNRASAWVNLSHNKNLSTTMNRKVLTYQTSDVRQLNSLKNELVKLGYKKAALSYETTSDICSRYTNGLFIFDLCTKHIEMDDIDILEDRNVIVVTISKYLSANEKVKVKAEIAKKEEEMKRALKYVLYNSYLEELAQGNNFELNDDYVVTKKTYLKSEDNVGSESLRVLDSSSHVKLLSDNAMYGNYYLVLNDQTIGYIQKKYLTKYKEVEIDNIDNDDSDWDENSISQGIVLNNKMCSNVLYKATLYSEMIEYRNIFSEPTYTDMSKVVISLPDKAIVNVIDELKNESLYYVVCYNGKIGYISKNIIIKND